jgi:hypothetical protein
MIKKKTVKIDENYLYRNEYFKDEEKTDKSMKIIAMETNR